MEITSMVTANNRIIQITLSHLGLPFQAPFLLLPSDGLTLALGAAAGCELLLREKSITSPTLYSYYETSVIHKHNWLQAPINLISGLDRPKSNRVW